MCFLPPLILLQWAAIGAGGSDASMVECRMLTHGGSVSAARLLNVAVRFCEDEGGATGSDAAIVACRMLTHGGSVSAARLLNVAVRFCEDEDGALAETIRLSFQPPDYAPWRIPASRS